MFNILIELAVAIFKTKELESEPYNNQVEEYGLLDGLHGTEINITLNQKEKINGKTK